MIIYLDGNKVSALRKKLGVSQREMSDAIGTSRQNLYRIENGSPVGVNAKIAEAVVNNLNGFRREGSTIVPDAQITLEEICYRTPQSAQA